MLDPNNTSQAYQLGRLFAAFEKTQQDALGDLNAGLRDKYFASASATPASIFPVIIKTYGHHLAKLEDGQKINRERLVQDIMANFTEWTPRLDLKQQGEFAIGYYHQRKDFFTKKEPNQNDSPESPSN